MAKDDAPPPLSDVIDPAILKRAQRKAALRLLPLLFCCYVIAYVNRANVSIAMLTMKQDLPGFDNEVLGLGAGLFFIGYFLLEVPCALLVEKWSARKLICRILVTWGIFAALTGFVKTPTQFYIVRFLLGLAEAGFFPGVLVYLSHWFPGKARAISWFLIATPAAQIISPKISNALLKIGTSETINGHLVSHPAFLGLVGWQWIYIFWGLPAIILGIIVYFNLADRPGDARWLTVEERQALEASVAQVKARRAPGQRMTLRAAVSHPKVLLLALAYCCGVTANYGVEFFLPSILKDWYVLGNDATTWLILLPPGLALASQLFVGWNSDRTRERRLHSTMCLLIGVIALGLTPITLGHLPLTIGCFMIAAAGIKGYQPPFWALPGLFLSETAAAGSIAIINSVGQIGGFIGPWALGKIQTDTHSYNHGIYFLCASMLVSAAIIFLLGVGRKEAAPAS